MLLTHKAKLFFQDESGLTVVEYVVGASVMLIGLSGLFAAFRDVLSEEFDSLFS
ncbi:Flp family type IVb pilin [Vibrio atypicus]|uniref:Flp family type IVb pilin n=1 Tax=Vibrio atypicus TaxID=558271 RepID=UPI003736F61B